MEFLTARSAITRSHVMWKCMRHDVLFSLMMFALMQVWIMSNSMWWQVIATWSVSVCHSWHIIHKGHLHKSRKKSTPPFPLSALVIVAFPPLWTSTTTARTEVLFERLGWRPGVLRQLRLLTHIPAYKFRNSGSFCIKVGGQLICGSADLLSVVAVIVCQSVRTGSTKVGCAQYMMLHLGLPFMHPLYSWAELSCGQLSAMICKISHWSVKLDMSWYQSDWCEQSGGQGRERTRGYTCRSPYAWDCVVGTTVKLPHIIQFRVFELSSDTVVQTASRNADCSQSAEDWKHSSSIQSADDTLLTSAYAETLPPLVRFCSHSA